MSNDAAARVIQAAWSLDRALDETVESALWLDIKDSRRVYRARCRLGRALRAYDAAVSTGAPASRAACDPAGALAASPPPPPRNHDA